MVVNSRPGRTGLTRLCVALSFVLAWAWPQPVATKADVAAAPRAPQAQFRSRSDIVEVYTTVTGRNGAGVSDLRGDEFELFEDGKRREIAVFSALVQPLSVAIILDHSGSTDREFAQVIQAAGAFIGRLFKEDRARIDTLGWDCGSFTGDRATLVATLQKPLPKDPGSPIWSATDRAMAALTPELGRRVILLLTDGQDNQREILDAPVRSGRSSAPPAKPPEHGCVRADISKLVLIQDVIDRAERDAVMVYAVAVPSADPSGGVGFGGSSAMGGASGSSVLGPPPIERDPRAELTKLARRSGGSVQQLTDYAQLAAAFKVIADELHLQYLLGFVPTKSDGKRHDITVRVKRPGVTVRAREAYIAQGR